VADTLLIHFNPKDADNAAWSLVNGAGELATMLSHGSLSDASPLAANHRTVVLLDSTAIHVDSIELPIKNHQKLLRAAPFALEEKIADDIDDLHFVAGKTASDGRTPVAAISRNTLNGILEALKQYNIEPAAIIPDALCLTANSQQWSVLLHNDQANIQFDTFDAGEFDRNILALLLESELLKEDRKTPEKIILFTADGDDTDTQEINDIIPDGTELIRVSYNTHPLVVYCGEYNHALPLNLLQGEYKPESKTSVNWHRWRFAASLAVIWLCLHLGIASVQQHGFQDSNKKLQVEINNIYKKAFPQSKRIVNARVQMEQKLNELKGLGKAGSNNSLMALLSDSSTALSSEKSVSIQSINYRNNTLDVEVTGANLQNIEQLNKKLNNKSLKAEIVSSSSEKNQVKGNIRIKRASQS